MLLNSFINSTSRKELDTTKQTELKQYHCFSWKFSSVQLLGHVMQPHGLEHARLPCLLGASVRNSAHGKGHEERGFGIRKGGSSLRKPPVPKHLPSKPKSAYFNVLCSHLYLWLYRGLTSITSLGEGVNLQLQVNKNPWAWQECFNLWTPLKVI